jgi:hypothetical protein
MYQIATILLIIAATGIIGGWAGYLIDLVSSGGESNQLRKQACTRYMVLGVISAACVPLFLSLVQSALITNYFYSRKGRQY